MKEYYKLQVSLKPSIENFNAITDLLQVKSTETDSFSSKWVYEVAQDGNGYYDFINKFLDILENKYEALVHLGIERSDITIWYLYEYDQQCNMEFDPIKLKRIGHNGISLCISCWEK